MDKNMISEGDICMLDESIEYVTSPNKPYPVLVLWNGVNDQPLVTKLGGYEPFWASYSELSDKIGHIAIGMELLSAATKEIMERGLFTGSRTV